MKSSQLLNLAILFNVWIYGAYSKDAYDKAIATKDEKNDKLRICIVENRGSFRRTEKYCPIIEKNTNIECIIGVDRLDCARRIQKGYAHFGVFSSEDLVGARWATFEILVTNEIRFHSDEFEYEVVVVVDNEANINSAADLKKSRLCHPGKGLEGNWNDVISDYLESVMIPRECETDLTLAESRIKATANFFGPSCKAGPWLSDPVQDQILKKRYPSLCSLCYDPTRCGIGDKHWGRRGPLDCLTGGSGQAAYIRLDDVRSFFGFTGLTAEADPNGYSFLCPDGHLQPLTVNNPCTWIAKPWPVIAARRTHAEKIQEMFRDIDINKDWQQALLMLLESYHVNISTLDIPMPIDDYLDKSSGYQSAHSFPACYPPRHIVYCTTSIIEFVKCSWLQEISTVYGIEPNLQCIRGESLFRCLDDVEKGIADVVRVDEEVRIKSERNFNLSPLLFEFSTDFESNHVTVAVVKKGSKIQSFLDIKGKTACFPSYEGSSFYSVMHELQQLKYIQDNCSKSIDNFFSPASCYGQENCRKEFSEDNGALKCLNEFGDIAFINLQTYKKLNDTNENLRVICPGSFETKKYKRSSDICYLSWTSKGTLLINKSKTQLRRNEIISSLKSMDHYFGKYRFRAGDIPFTLFGPFDQKEDVLFRDSTDGFKTEYEIINYSKFDRSIESFYNKLLNDDSHQCSSANSVIGIKIIFLVISAIIVKFLS
ncbi:hypothetical protein PVAND_009707 [Polypedilum vanderplanki]|uniref:Transferrin-like domain-containing protein n=1 Tax=Polypedilum vanderplanki TaxID=319348 RepID=A0A9J6CEY4_POLVA|nr:hypothetical protein PVAND_009707 [Polypedilum vanderplanki]